MVWTTAVAFLRSGEYVFGLRMSARSHETLVDHDGGDAEAVTEDHCGSPERLQLLLASSHVTIVFLR